MLFYTYYLGKRNKFSEAGAERELGVTVLLFLNTGNNRNLPSNVYLSQHHLQRKEEGK